MGKVQISFTAVLLNQGHYTSPGHLTMSGDIFDCHDRQGWLEEEGSLLLASTGVETGNAAKHPTTHKRTPSPSPNYQAQSINSEQVKKTLL